MPELTTPRELFLHELGDILYVERALAEETLPKLIAEVSDEELKSGLQSHLEETRQHVANVEKVFELLGEDVEVEKCVGFEGLKAEHDQLIEESASSLTPPHSSRPRSQGRDRRDSRARRGSGQGRAAGRGLHEPR